MKKSPWLLNFIVDENVKVIHDMAQNKNIFVENSTSEDIFVIVDNELLSTVIRNIITNALKFTASGGKISIAAFVEGEKAELEIRDTGIGMTQEQVEKLYKIGEKKVLSARKMSPEPVLG